MEGPVSPKTVRLDILSRHFYDSVALSFGDLNLLAVQRMNLSRRDENFVTIQERLSDEKLTARVLSCRFPISKSSRGKCSITVSLVSGKERRMPHRG